MIVITRNMNAVKAEKRYKPADVAQAIGRTEGSISGYFSNRGISVKNGITLDQIEELLHARTRGEGIHWDLVEEIRNRLITEKGYEIKEV
jgi:hypothetical protein